VVRPFSLSDPVRARQMADAMAILAPPTPIKIVHVCGTHEMAITQHGLRRFLPEKVEILEGPGCPVCVTPTADIDAAVQIAEAGAILCTFGDMTRVPGTRLTLEQARSTGCDIRVVLSAAEAANIAKGTDREVVFFAVGFETTTPMTAAVLLDDAPANFSALVSHKKIPEAMAVLLNLPGTNIHGYLAPGHVSTILGLAPYARQLETFKIPIVVGGFEPLDILYAIALILRQIRDGKGFVENGFPRGVANEGNIAAQMLIETVFESTEVQWRGIGAIPESGYRLRDKFAQFDARLRFNIEGETGDEHIPGCRCADVLTARATPADCPLFGERCTPLSPVGPCMVGTEGACSIWFRYGGREIP
jgi:hydrogenase expression/formation protein HypD